MKFYKFFRKSILILGLLFVSFAFFSNLIVLLLSHDLQYTDITKLPNKEIALVLGTSKYTSDNTYNQFYKNRINSAYQLIKNKKVKKLLLSGSSDGGYNEAQQMREDLLKMGVNRKQMILDEKSDRTINSIKRASKNFGFNDFIIVSQFFHTQRAVAIAALLKIKTIAYISPTPGKISLKTYLREILARIKMLGDILYN